MYEYVQCKYCNIYVRMLVYLIKVIKVLAIIYGIPGEVLDICICTYVSICTYEYVQCKYVRNVIFMLVYPIKVVKVL